MATAPVGLKDRLRAMWMAGDYGRLALHSAPEAETFVNGLDLAPGSRVLDAACGTGNLAIPAARRGAIVTGVDIAPNLLEQARARAAREGLRAAFDEGDVEALPYADGAFDVVMTMFGAMFAPSPERAAGELARVCRPGGAIIMANWTPGGFAGRMFRIQAKHAPPPDGIAPPAQWGDETIARQRLAPYASKIETTVRMAKIDFEFGPRQVVQFFRDYFGPTKTAFERLDEAGQAALAADMEAFWSECNQAGPDRTLVLGEYLQVVATRV